MKKIIILNGAARKTGNTAKLIQALPKVLKAQDTRSKSSIY